MTISLCPVAGEQEFSDPRNVGDWAGELQKMAGAMQQPPWCSYAVRREGRLVGMGGFKGPPNAANAVEIGYLTFRPVEGQRIASEVASELLQIAATAGAAKIIAHTLPEENGSTIVLRRNGFELVGEVVDPEDGTVWRWETSPPSS